MSFKYLWFPSFCFTVLWVQLFHHHGWLMNDQNKIGYISNSMLFYNREFRYLNLIGIVKYCVYWWVAGRGGPRGWKKKRKAWWNEGWRTVRAREVKKWACQKDKLVFALFPTWCAEKHLDKDFNNITKSELTLVLREFYATVKNAKGEPYDFSSYGGLRAGLKRHIDDTLISLSWCIVKDPEFTTSSHVFTAFVKKVQREGRDTSSHSPA